MKYFIYSITVLLLLQGCGGDSGNGEDLNADPTENTNVPLETTETIETVETIEEARFIDLPINPTFTRVNGNIVKEEQSNLYWQDNIAAKTTIEKFAQAESYCASLTLDEIDSWRLPTYNELLTIVNYERLQPSVYDTFQNTNDKEYWTQTEHAASESLYKWTIHFKRGKVHFVTGAYPSHFSTTHNVRCVSDEFANKRLKERDFSKSGDVVTDNIHGLLWQDALNTKVDKHSFLEADAYCDNLSLGGLTSGWRVPTVKELASLMKIEAYDPSIDGNFTSTAYNDAYWTSESQANGTASGSDTFKWDINFKDGVISTGGIEHESFDQYVRCVRNQ
jgi:hypothetical protein